MLHVALTMGVIVASVLARLGDCIPVLDVDSESLILRMVRDLGVWQCVRVYVRST